jgi:hypothetical protein
MHGGAWGERRYSYYSFTTSALTPLPGSHRRFESKCPGKCKAKDGLFTLAFQKSLESLHKLTDYKLSNGDSVRRTELVHQHRLFWHCDVIMSQHNSVLLTIITCTLYDGVWDTNVRLLQKPRNLSHEKNASALSGGRFIWTIGSWARSESSLSSAWLQISRAELRQIMSLWCGLCG